MPHAPQERLSVTREPPAARRRPQAAPGHASIFGLQRGAGNRAVAGLLGVQRDIGWKGASTKGYGWNSDKGPRSVGKIKRLPLDGLDEGMPADGGKRETTKVPELTTESAQGKAIVLVPENLDPAQKIEVLVFLHGHTEDEGRPYAGWRALDGTKPPVKDKDDRRNLERFRKGIDEKDTAPVRDVALDDAEKQLEESGQKQLVIVLPQGGLHSQFDKDGRKRFNATYVSTLMKRLTDEHVWHGRDGKDVKAPEVGSITMGGHSGGGAVLADMANVSLIDAGRRKLDKGEKPSTSSGLSGDLVLFDAINGPNERNTFQEWATLRLDQDLEALKGKPDDKARLEYLKTSQKLRGYFHGGDYQDRYAALDQTIRDWFTPDHVKDAGGDAIARILRANYSIKQIPGEHEEILRGSAAGTPRPQGKGGILDAITGLHTTIDSVDKAPPWPEPIKKR